MNKKIYKEVVVKASTELIGFEVEVPALNSNINMQMTLPSVVVFNPFTQEKVVLGARLISYERFESIVKSIIATHNLKKHKAQQVELPDEAIKAIYNITNFSEYNVGDTISYPFDIPDRWFQLKTGRYGFKWKNPLGAGLLIIADEPCFTMIDFDHELLGLKKSQFTYLVGEHRKDRNGESMFLIKPNGKHWLVKNVIRKEPQLKDIANRYYRLAQDKGSKNEYAIIDAIVVKGDIKVETVIVKQLPDPPAEVYVDVDTNDKGDLVPVFIAPQPIETYTDDSTVTEVEFEREVDIAPPMAGEFVSTPVVASESAEDFIEQLEAGKKKKHPAKTKVKKK